VGLAGEAIQACFGVGRGPALNPSARLALDARAYALMVGCCLLWGLQQVAVKVALPDISPVMQGGLRSIIAITLLLAWARARTMPLFDRDGTLGPGLVAGALFAGEFFLIYYGLPYTSASRMVVFLYLAPCLTALGLALFVAGEQLSTVQWTGTLVAFGGIVVGFADGLLGGGETTFRGDLCGVLAAAFWAATTVVIRATRLASASATKTLGYQLGVSALLLPPLSLALGEPGVMRLTALSVGSLIYQGVIVAFAGYLIWFWLLTRYLAGRLAVFGFLTPMAGVAFGVLLLDERLTPVFGLGALLVAAGIALVNAPRAPA